ncbi:MAG: phenylacetate--CoA ligase family protein [Clostridia bacterium]|nr:MAG: phenylacetate--CoA ligase family protein [Clostridia bacterium]
MDSKRFRRAKKAIISWHDPCLRIILLARFTPHLYEALRYQLINDTGGENALAICYAPVIETMERHALEELQFNKLLNLLRFAYNSIPFYRVKCDAVGVRPGDIGSLDDFYAKWPMIMKADLIQDQEANPPYGTRIGVPMDKVVQIHITSGTSGSGQEVYLQTVQDVEYSGTLWTLHFFTTGIRKGDIVANLIPMGPLAGSLSIEQSLAQLGAIPLHLAIYDTEVKLKYMRKFRVNYMLTQPAYLTRLALFCKELGLDPRQEFPSLKGITIMAEPYPVFWAQQMESFWGCTIHEIYGSTQVGSILAGSCEPGVTPNGQRGTLHIYEHSNLVEVRNPETNDLVADGQAGELIITTLSRQGSPLIRYRTGDLVTLVAYDRCGCGRTLNALQAGTVCRLDDMIKMKGTNVWPQAVEEVVFSREEIEEYNGRVFIDEQGREQVELLIEFKRGYENLDRAPFMAKLVTDLKDKTQVTMLVREVPYGTIQRYEYKVRRWRDEREVGLGNINL